MALYTPDPYNSTQPTDADWVRVGAAEFRALKAAFMKPWVPKIITASTYTVVSGDVGQLIWMQNGGNIIIPVGLPAGLFGVTGLQTTTVQAAIGVTLEVPPTLLSTLYEDNAFAVVMQREIDNWLISGNLMFNGLATSTTPDRLENPVTVLQQEMVDTLSEISRLTQDSSSRDTAISDLQQVSQDHEIRIAALENSGGGGGGNFEIAMAITSWNTYATGATFTKTKNASPWTNGMQISSGDVINSSGTAASSEYFISESLEMELELTVPDESSWPIMYELTPTTPFSPMTETQALIGIVTSEGVEVLAGVITKENYESANSIIGTWLMSSDSIVTHPNSWSTPMALSFTDARGNTKNINFTLSGNIL